ncbi:MAG TPA: hypothetical protein VFP84_35575 [Kofleriaceae bacterium]|nr:hypothetical protein [Kofleriaceae bacterium]
MRRALVVLLVCVGCAPDTALTAFLCGAGDACPADQVCLAGRCRRGPAPHADGVICGGARCTTDEQCCVDGTNPPRCLAAANANCPGLVALCDGEEDCTGGDKCCADASLVTCSTDCTTVVCQTDDDCPAGRPNCCMADPAVSWGTCQLASC